MLPRPSARIPGRYRYPEGRRRSAGQEVVTAVEQFLGAAERKRIGPQILIDPVFDPAIHLVDFQYLAAAVAAELHVSRVAVVEQGHDICPMHKLDVMLVTLPRIRVGGK